MYLFDRSEFGLDGREAQGLRDTISEFRVSLVEVLDCSLANFSGDTFHGAGQVGNSVFSHSVIEHLPEQVAGLGEVAVGVVRFMPGDQSSDLIGLISGFAIELESVLALAIEGVGLIVRCGSYIK